MGIWLKGGESQPEDEEEGSIYILSDN